MIYDVIIIGAGASGLVCGIEATKKGNKVCILDQKEKAGKKLYATGNGKCNFGNMDNHLSHYHSLSKTSIADINGQTIIDNSTPEFVKDYFLKLGIPCVERQGYLYPRSEQAASIALALEQQYLDLNGELHLNETVVRVERKCNQQYIIKTNEREYCARKLVLATGGKSNPKLGSDGSGYLLAKQLGHTVTDCVPALCGMHCKDKAFHKLQGVRVKGQVTLWIDNQKVASDSGEIQFTQYGISGIVVFNLSRYVSITCEQRKQDVKVAGDQTIKVSLDVLSDYSEEAFVDELIQMKHIGMNRSIYDILHGYLPDKLVDELLKQVHIEGNKMLQDVSKKELICIIKCAKSITYSVVGVNDFSQSQVTAGGVPLDEIQLASMESRIAQGLYIIGELLDVDADCGGYNLMWAWRTGYLAGQAI